MANAKPVSKKSTVYSTSSMNYTSTDKITLWNYITQPQAAMVSQNMYKDNEDVSSDLINSYAWDTAIVYIQEMGNTNYANTNRGQNTSLKNTGDEKCKIFDMAANTYEWTTEYCTYTDSSYAYPSTYRGGYYLSNVSTSGRNKYRATNLYSRLSFRTVLYVK